MAKYGITNDQRYVFNLILYDNDYIMYLYFVMLHFDFIFFDVVCYKRHRLRMYCKLTTIY